MSTKIYTAGTRQQADTAYKADYADREDKHQDKHQQRARMLKVAYPNLLNAFPNLKAGGNK